MLNLFQKKEEPSGPVEYLIVGLGNPGAQYEGTRHNAGFMAMDVLAEKAGVKLDRLKFKGLCAPAVVGGKRCCC
jgi:PTH1 family peptidyl-tRNA hydrolase